MPTVLEFLLLQFQRPGSESLWPVAVLLFDPSNDKLLICGREEYASIADADDAQILAGTVKQLQEDATVGSGGAILAMLESSLSGSVRLTERISLRSRDPAATLDSLSTAFLS